MQLSEPVLQDIGRQLCAGDRHFRHKFPAFAEDILQEAWTAALDAAPRYRRDDPGARGYFYRVAVLHVAPQINRWLAVTSLSRHAARAGEGTRQFHWVPPVHVMEYENGNGRGGDAYLVGTVEDVPGAAPAPDAWIPVREAQARALTEDADSAPGPSTVAKAPITSPAAIFGR